MSADRQQTGPVLKKGVCSNAHQRPRNKIDRSMVNEQDANSIFQIVNLCGVYAATGMHPGGSVWRQAPVKHQARCV